MPFNIAASERQIESIFRIAVTQAVGQKSILPRPARRKEKLLHGKAVERVTQRGVGNSRAIQVSGG